MSPSSLPRDGVRSAAAVNEAIRALITGTGRRLTDVEKRTLEGLYEEWAAAVRAEITEAA